MWKDIAGFDGFYQVSDDGHVRSLDRVFVNAAGVEVNYRGRLIKSVTSQNGYLRCSLNVGGVKTQCLVHRLVAKAFVENPDGCTQVNHIDGDKKNNKASNLEWCTPKHNIEHAHKSGLMKPSRGQNHWNAKLSEADVREIVRLRAENWTVESIAKRFGCHTCPITKILCGYGWSHITGISPRRRTNGKGQSNARSSITNDQALQIVELKNAGKSVREIMAIVGSSLQTTQRVCRGEAFASVTGLAHQKRRRVKRIKNETHIG